jgi:hypothetical protein
LPRLPNVDCTPEGPRTTSVRFEFWRKLGLGRVGVNRDFAHGRGEEIEEAILRLD